MELPDAGVPGEEPTNLAALVEEVLLGERGHLTREEVVARSGLPLELTSQLWRTLGFVDTAEPVFTSADVAALRSVSRLLAEFDVPTAVIEAVARTMGHSLSRLAEAHLDVTSDLVRRALDDLELSPEQLDLVAGAIVTESARMIEPLQDLMVYVWRRHLVAASQRALATTAVDGDGDQAQVAVGFVDIVGFTSATRDLDSDSLRALIEEFESIAFDTVTRAGGRVVKTLGDEVMFAAPSATAGAEIGLSLAEAFDGSGRVSGVRVGVGYGSVLLRGGDAFGNVVNVASRCTSMAKPGTVLVDRGMTEALRDEDAFALRQLRPVAVRGYEHLLTSVLRRRRAD